MEGYLGETKVKSLVGTPFEGYEAKDWALYYIGSYGQIDGSHHKQWVLDQVARILHGTKVKVVLAKWNNGHEEYRVNLASPSAAYKKWVKEMRGEFITNESSGDGYYEYEYDEGIAP